MAHEFILIYENEKHNFSARLLKSTGIGEEKQDGVLFELLGLYKITEHCPSIKFRVLYLDLDNKKIYYNENVLITINNEKETDDGVSCISWEYFNHLINHQQDAIQLYQNMSNILACVFPPPEETGIEVTQEMITAALQFWPSGIESEEVMNITTGFLTNIYTAMAKAARKHSDAKPTPVKGI